MDLQGQAFERGTDGYEQARRSTVWNARTPDRYPDLIVQATTVEDVQAAVRHAASAAMKVGVRSGGHSWAGSHLRNGGMLLDVSRLNSVEVDAPIFRAKAGPGTRGDELCDVLVAVDRFFPSGHCRGVCLGGYLLQGGYGWNSRLWGPACESVLGIDVVTADGTLIHADAEHDADLYWASRGSGPGYFGVVTSFDLQLHPKPAEIGASLYVYPMTVLEELFTWLHGIGPAVDRRVEVQALLGRSFAALGVDQPAIALGSPVFADSQAEAREAVALLSTCPVIDSALFSAPYASVDMTLWYDAVMDGYQPDQRYAVDNMWSEAAIEDLLPGLRHIADTLPPSPSHCLWLNWGPSPARADMPYSLESPTYIALYGAWKEAADDAKYENWATDCMRLMEPVAAGTQLADENLGRRPAAFASAAAMARLDTIRSDRDPNGMFHAWMGRV